MIGARLILEDGGYFEGKLFGAVQAAAGEALSRKGMAELQIKDLQHIETSRLSVMREPSHCGIARSARSICVSDFLDTANAAAGPKHNLVLEYAR